MLPLTAQAQHAVAAVLTAGDVAVDATAGNGHDTCFLARAVGETGRVHAFDRQVAAIEATRARLGEEALLGRVVLHQGCHSRMGRLVVEGKARAVMFNLGYLPGSERDVITSADSTLAALDQAVALLTPGGILSVIAYTGHPGGRREADAVRTWAEHLPAERFAVGWTVPAGTRAPPEWLLARRIG